MTLLTFFATFLIGIVTSFYGVSIGGGGLLVVPALMFLGLESREAIATATFATIVIAGTGFREFKKSKKIDLKLASWASIEFGLGTLMGAFILTSLPEDLVKRIIGCFLILLAIIGLFSSKVGLKNIFTSTFKKGLGHLLMTLTGVYKGFIYSGAAILQSYILIYFFGQTYLESSGTRKLPSLIASFIAVIIFLKADLIIWKIGLILMVGHLIGAYFGAHYALKKGEKWMKYAFSLIVGISAMELLF